MSLLNVDVMTSERKVCNCNAAEVSLPGIYGTIGVRPGHAPLIAELGLGVLEIKQDGKTLEKFFVSGGFLEIIDDQLTLLVDTIERCDDIDIDRADKAFDRAMERLRSRTGGVIDLDRALASLGRSRIRRTLSKL